MIFCVEDDAGIRELMVYTLNASGFEAVGFPDGAALFQALEAESELHMDSIRHILEQM